VQPMHEASSIRATARDPVDGGKSTRDESTPPFYRRRAAGAAADFGLQRLRGERSSSRSL
jgi:hypothetical protein